MYDVFYMYSGNTLLAAFGPLLAAVCTNHNKYPDQELQTAASLALAKFMMVSSEFCDQHLQLLFTILEKSNSSTIRANTIIALGDLSFRFPNLIEPWTPHLYARYVLQLCSLYKVCTIKPVLSSHSKIDKT